MLDDGKTGILDIHFGFQSRAVPAGYQRILPQWQLMLRLSHVVPTEVVGDAEPADGEYPIRTLRRQPHPAIRHLPSASYIEGPLCTPSTKMRGFMQSLKGEKSRNLPRPIRPYFSVFGRLFLNIIGKSRAAAPEFCLSKYEITFRFSNTSTDLRFFAIVQKLRFRSSVEEVHCIYGISASTGIRLGLDPRVRQDQSGCSSDMEVISRAANIARERSLVPCFGNSGSPLVHCCNNATYNKKTLLRFG